MQKRRLIYELNMARHTLVKAMDARCRHDLGVSFVQLSALMVLKEQSNCLMKELAHTLMLDNSAITGLVKRMLASGLIHKNACQEDARASRLMMSSKGAEVLSKGMQLLHEGNQLMHNGFSEAELDTVSRYLKHLTMVFSQRSST